MLGIWTRGSSPNSEGSCALYSPFRFSGGESVTGFVANGAQQTWKMYVIVYACTAHGCMCQWCLASPRKKHTPSSRLLRDVNGYVGKSHTSRSSRKHYQAENWSLRCGAEGRWWCRHFRKLGSRSCGYSDDTVALFTTVATAAWNPEGKLQLSCAELLTSGYWCTECFHSLCNIVL